MQCLRRAGQQGRRLRARKVHECSEEFTFMSFVDVAQVLRGLLAGVRQRAACLAVVERVECRELISMDFFVGCDRLDFPNHAP